MTKLQDLNELRPLEMIDQVVNLWGKTVVPLFTTSPNSDHKAHGCGSAFVVERYGVLFLVTALHVLKGLKDGEPFVGNIAGKGALLNGLHFVTSPADDLAIALIEPIWAQSQGIAKAFPLPLDAPGPSWTLLDSFILLGYPGAKNKLNWGTNEITRQLIGYSSSRRIEQPRSSTHIRNPIAFGFDKKSAVNTNEDRINVGLFNGNSGGPVLEICGRLIDGDALNFSARLAGVFIGWDKHHKELICCRPKIVADLIDGLA